MLLALDLLFEVGELRFPLLLLISFGLNLLQERLALLRLLRDGCAQLLLLLFNVGDLFLQLLYGLFILIDVILDFGRLFLRFHVDLR